MRPAHGGHTYYFFPLDRINPASICTARHIYNLHAITAILPNHFEPIELNQIVVQAFLFNLVNFQLLGVQVCHCKKTFDCIKFHLQALRSRHYVSNNSFQFTYRHQKTKKNINSCPGSSHRPIIGGGTMFQQLIISISLFRLNRIA